MELSPQTIQDLGRLIHQWSGLVIGPDKGYLVRHRLEPLIKSSGLKGFDELLDRLQTKGQARLHNAVIDAMTTKETSFFRDPWFFEALFKYVLPELVSAVKGSAGRRSHIRIWSAGSSTGQEAYSLAMLLRESIDASKGDLKDHHFSIVASDISGDALDSAREGMYTRAMVDRGLSEPRLRRHFTCRGDRWIANDSLRRLVAFRQFNLLHSPAELGSFDLVLCRNVMIYFDEPTRQRVCRNLHRTLRPGALLAVGAAESLSVSGDLQPVKFGNANLYRRSPAGD